MKVLLVAINAKYIHSNLALLSLKSYANAYHESIELIEYTINNYTDSILGDIYKKKPDFIGFSCYIWNISVVKELIKELRKILPDTKIWMGGPEVSYDAEECLKEENYIDGIMIGEGEETFLELMDYYHGGNIQLENVKGIAYPDKQTGKIQVTALRPLLDMSHLPFPYDNLSQFKHKIIYYETSRGCPYSCSYCLSSIDKSIRLRKIELVKKELNIFLEYKIPQVKFIDRTFNCNRTHAMEIWRYIHEHDNGITNFHFEISADLLGEEELKLLSTFREGLVQLEIGIQSTNQKTIEAVHRHMDLKKLSYAVNKVYEARNIHQHLDLIAGLPYENYDSFRNSFNDVYCMKPDQLQLGFLKVLKGSNMHLDSDKYHIIYKNTPPYEVLRTEWLTYDEVLELKKVEEMVEVYYNSGQFSNAISYLIHFHTTPFDLFWQLGDYYEKENLHQRSHSRMSRYEILADYFEQVIEGDSRTFKEILIYDLYSREKLKSRPVFANDDSEYKEIYKKLNNKKGSKLTHIEHFNIDINKTVKTGVPLRKSNFILFDYENRNPLNHEARIRYLEE